MNCKHIFWQILTVGLLLLPSVAAQVIYTVPTDYTTIGAAINTADDGDFVIVEDGVYSGQGNTDLDLMGKAIIVRSENGPGSCYIVCGHSARAFIMQTDESRDTVISGFTIIHGYSDTFGGAIFCNNASPLIENCHFENNRADYGAAIATLNGFPQIDNCYFYNNHATYDGAGIFCANSTALISSSRFAWNFADAGGGIYSCWFSNPTIINCLIDWNSADHGGGAAAEFLSFLTIENTTIANNSGCGVYTNWGNFSSINSIFAGNTLKEFETGDMEPDLTYCCIPGGFSGEGNIDASPLFGVGPHSDYYLKLLQAPAVNPCVDAGNQESEKMCWTVGSDIYCMSDLTTQADLALDSGIVDIGCHFVGNDDCRRLGVRFIGVEELPDPGDLVDLEIEVCNPGNILHIDMALFIIMEQFGEYWFWPAWTLEPDWDVVTISPGVWSLVVMPPTTWTGSGPEWFNSRFYSALTDSAVSEIRGEIGIYPYRFEPIQ
ncbi:right-handed parallel beta-helix repeat-containing protein [bacterium]|nr:right-handed parallel beta-helix repeat-containing protein [candidate division CSSED10-310 bacterium]